MKNNCYKKLLPLAVVLLFSSCISNKKMVYSKTKEALYIGTPIQIDSFNKYYKPIIDSLGGKY